MKEYALDHRLKETRSEPGKRPDLYYSVEMSVDGLGVIYQFKIWTVQSESMFIIVKENSDILKCLKAGDTLNMKYYSSDSVYPLEYMDTEIQDITKQEQGRLKGHYLVSLVIVESPDHDKIHWPYALGRHRSTYRFQRTKLLRNIKEQNHEIV